MEKTIKKIHRKFDTASEKLLAEAKALIAASPINDAERIARFHKIGFGTAKPIKDAEEMFKKQQSAKEMIEAIEYYQTHYPSYKFIPEEAIQKICKKYELLYGDADKYIGDIPEKNLKEIEGFKLRDEDIYEESLYNISNILDSYMGLMMPRRSGRQDSNLWNYFTPQWAMGVDPYGTPEGQEGFKGIIPAIKEQEKKATVTVKKKKQPFKICAPKKDFSIRADDQIKDGWKLIDDPIVIQPVKYKTIAGGLIISKWGIEGQDESLTNEKMN